MKTITIGEKLDYCAEQLSREQPLFNESQSLNAEKQALQEDLEVGKIERLEDFPSDISFWGYLGYLILFVILYVIVGASIENAIGPSEDSGAFLGLGMFIVPFVLLFYLRKFKKWRNEMAWNNDYGHDYLMYYDKKTKINNRLAQIENRERILNKELDVVHEKNFGLLYEILTSKEFSIPVPLGSLWEDNYSDAIDLFLAIYGAMNRKAAATSIDEKKQIAKEIADFKLDLFYIVSLSYGTSQEAYDSLLPHGSSFDPDAFREIAVSKANHIIQKNRIDDCINLLDNNMIDEILHELEYVKNRDVSGFLGLYTDTDKMSEQYEDMKKLREAAVEEYEELNMVCDELNSALDHIRTYAFRNIYLGIEMLNYIREGAGGSGLIKESDYVSMQELDISQFSNTFQGYKTNNVSDTIKKYDNVARAIINNRDFRKLVYSNKKVAAGAALIGVATMAMSAAADHAAKVDRIQANQANIVKDMQTIVDGYTEGRAQLYRVIEVAQSILKANEGFMYIYNQLKTKLFDSNQVLTLPEIQDLCKAIKAYKEISNSKIK